MKTATVRDLRTAFPKVESWLSEGEEVTITKGGKPVAMLVQPRLVKRKLNFKARFGGKSPKPRPGKSLVALLIEDRGE